MKQLIARDDRIAELEMVNSGVEEWKDRRIAELEGFRAELEKQLANEKSRYVELQMTLESIVEGRIEELEKCIAKLEQEQKEMVLSSARQAETLVERDERIVKLEKGTNVLSNWRKH